MLARSLSVSLALLAPALFLVPSGGAHSGPQPCTDSTAVHLYYGGVGFVSTTVNAVHIERRAGQPVVFDSCANVAFNGNPNLVGGVTEFVTCTTLGGTVDTDGDGVDDTIVAPTGEIVPGVGSPLFKSSLLIVDTTSALVDTSDPDPLNWEALPGWTILVLPCWDHALIGVGDGEQESGIGGAALPLFSPNCGQNGHHFWGFGAPSVVAHLGAVVYQLAVDTAFVPCVTDGILDCFGTLGLSSPGANAPAGDPPCESGDGFGWVLVYEGVVTDVPGAPGIWVSTPIQGDIS